LPRLSGSAAREAHACRNLLPRPKSLFPNDNRIDSRRELWKLTPFAGRSYFAVRSKSNHFRPQGEGERPVKTLVTLALVALLGTTIVGCKASAEVDPNNNAQISIPR
jgi:hypothetical protein